jgi:predicted phosphoribosyltransferase
MYEDLSNFESALVHFGTRVDIIIALEMGGKLDAETAYQNIKDELKELKRVRKSYKKDKDL